jgi:hypothetical protein
MSQLPHEMVKRGFVIMDCSDDSMDLSDEDTDNEE